MNIVLQAEFVDGACDPVVEPHRRGDIIVDREDIDMDPVRVGLTHGETGVVLLAHYVPGVPTDAGHQMDLRVGRMPAFGDDRTLPKWPMTWTPNGSSVRFKIECPDGTDVDIETG